MLTFGKFGLGKWQPPDPLAQDPEEGKGAVPEASGDLRPVHGVR